LLEKIAADEKMAIWNGIARGTKKTAIWETEMLGRSVFRIAWEPANLSHLIEI